VGREVAQMQYNYINKTESKRETLTSLKKYTISVNNFTRHSICLSSTTMSIYSSCLLQIDRLQHRKGLLGCRELPFIFISLFISSFFSLFALFMFSFRPFILLLSLSYIIFVHFLSLFIYMYVSLSSSPFC
jgi:hypothetical protein